MPQSKQEFSAEVDSFVRGTTFLSNPEKKHGDVVTIPLAIGRGGRVNIGIPTWDQAEYCVDEVLREILDAQAKVFPGSSYGKEGYLTVQIMAGERRNKGSNRQRITLAPSVAEIIQSLNAVGYPISQRDIDRNLGSLE